MKRIRIVCPTWDPQDARVELEDGQPLDGVEKVVVTIVPEEIPRAVVTFLAPIVEVAAELDEGDG